MNDHHLSRGIQFLYDTHAVLGLPMRLTVSIIIGTVALAAILVYIMNPCLLPGKLIVSIDPLVHEIPTGQNSTEIFVYVVVTNAQGRPTSNAQVRVEGLGGIDSSLTNVSGETMCILTVTLEEGIREGYLDVSVKAACFELFAQTDMIKVVREL